ncbi:MAG: hypothetical protein P8Y18_04300 [Candidatus Bathyarchaeota archaeon]
MTLNGVYVRTILVKEMMHTVYERKDSKRNCKNILPEELVTYLDFAIRLKRSYEFILKIQDNQSRKRKK